jgi:hypothetical protein
MRSLLRRCLLGGICGDIHRSKNGMIKAARKGGPTSTQAILLFGLAANVDEFKEPQKRRLQQRGNRAYAVYKKLPRFHPQKTRADKLRIW